MYNTIHTNKKYSIILFLLWPFFALVYAIRFYRSSWSKNIIWLFVIFYGFTLTINNIGEETMDANRYRDNFILMANKQLGFNEFANSLYNQEEQKLDVIEPIVVFLLSRVTDNPQILFAVFGLIFGFFYSRNIWYLIERMGGKMAPANIVTIFTFAFIVGFWSINGFRFWTATHIFIFGTLPFLFEGKTKYLFFSVLAAFMHFSFLLPIGILFIYLLVGNRTYLYFILFFATFFIKELNLSQIRDFLTNNLPDIFLPKVKSYTNTEYAEGLAEGLEKVNWYVKFYADSIKWPVVVFLGIIFFTGKNFLAAHKNYKSLFSFTLLLYSFSNILSLLPSGDRFLVISNLFAIAFIFFYLQFAPQSRAINRVFPLAIPALALFNIVSVRTAFDTMGILSVLGNPLLSLFAEINVTLIDIVKSLF